jgi:hypothetical protein
MDFKLSPGSPLTLPSIDIREVASLIANTQQPDG